MIKMVCSDLDGTLLQYGKKLIEGEIFDEIRALHDRGILFCPASGRQYTSLRKLFAPVALGATKAALPTSGVLPYTVITAIILPPCPE